MTVSATATSRSLWRHRDFMLLWAGQSVSEIGSVITEITIPLLAVTTLGASTFQVGMLSAATTLPFLLVSLPAGAIIDRHAKRRLMTWCDLGRAALLASIPLFVLLGIPLTLPHLVIVALATGVLTVFFDVAYQSYLPIMLQAESLSDGNGKLGVTQSFAQFAGPSIGGIAIGLMGAARTIVLDAFSFIFSAVSLFMIHTREATPTIEMRRASTMRQEIAEGVSFIVRHRILRSVVACTSTSNFFMSMGFALQMVFLVRVLDVSPRFIGFILSAAAVGGMLGGALASRLIRWVGSARIIWFSILVLGLPQVFIPLSTPGWGVTLYALGLFFFMTTAVVYNVAQVSYRQVVTPPKLLGRMNASVRFIASGVMPLGAALGGALGSSIGVRETIWISVVGSWSAGLFVYFSPLRHIRNIEEVS